MQKIRNSIQYRLPIWQRMLTRPNGVSIDEMMDACAEFIGDSDDPKGILRRDLTTIRSLLDEVEGAQLIERKSGRSKRFWLEGCADLLRLRQERFYGSEKVTLTGMLTQMQGVLPEGVLQEVTTSIRKLERELTDEGKVHFLKHELMSYDMVESIMRTLKFSNDEIREVRFLALHHMDCKSWGSRCEQMKDKKLRKLQYLCKTEERFRMLMALIHADNMAHAEDKCKPDQVPMILVRTEQMKAEGSAMFGYALPLTGNDVMAIKGLKPGPQVKECMAYLLKVAFVDPLRTKEEFEKLLKGYRFLPQ